MAFKLTYIYISISIYLYLYLYLSIYLYIYIYILIYIKYIKRYVEVATWTLFAFLECQQHAIVHGCTKVHQLLWSQYGNDQKGIMLYWDNTHITHIHTCIYIIYIIYINKYIYIYIYIYTYTLYTYVYAYIIYIQNVFRIQCYYNLTLVTRGKRNYIGFVKDTLKAYFC